MSEVGQREIRTQRRVVGFFQEALGYTYLGDWHDRPGNRNVAEVLVTNWLRHRGHDDRIIDKALRELDKAAHSAAARHSMTRTARSTNGSATV